MKHNGNNGSTGFGRSVDSAVSKNIPLYWDWECDQFVLRAVVGESKTGVSIERSVFKGSYESAVSLNSILVSQRANVDKTSFGEAVRISAN